MIGSPASPHRLLHGKGAQTQLRFAPQEWIQRPVCESIVAVWRR